MYGFIIYKSWIAWRLCVPFIVYARRLCVAFMRGGMRRGLCGGVCRSPCLSLSAPQSRRMDYTLDPMMPHGGHPVPKHTHHEHEFARLHNFDMSIKEGDSLGMGLNATKGLTTGAMVSRVVPGGHADKLGVKVHWFVRMVGEVDVSLMENDDILDLINTTRPLQITFFTPDHPEHPHNDNIERQFDVKFGKGSMGFGVEAPEGCEEGSVVTIVDAGSPADLGGVVVGDTLIAIGDEDITHLDHEETVELIRTCTRPIVLHFLTTRPESPPQPDYSDLMPANPINTFVSVATIESAPKKSSDDHNLALCYACAEGDTTAVKAALHEHKRLLLDDTAEAGYSIGTIGQTGIMYQRDWADPDSDGDTASHMAAYAGSKPILRILFKQGWNPKAKNFSGTSVRQTASDYGQNDILAKWIKEYYDHGHITDSLGHADFRRTDIDDNLPRSTFGRVEQSSKDSPHVTRKSQVHDLRNLTKDECEDIEKQWENGRPVTFRLLSGSAIETTQVNTSFDLAERDLMYAKIQTLEEEKKHLESYIAEKLSAMQLKFREDLFQMTKNQRKEMETLAENFDRFASSPPPAYNKK